MLRKYRRKHRADYIQTLRFRAEHGFADLGAHPGIYAMGWVAGLAHPKNPQLAYGFRSYHRPRGEHHNLGMARHVGELGRRGAGTFVSLPTGPGPGNGCGRLEAYGRGGSPAGAMGCAGVSVRERHADRSDGRHYGDLDKASNCHLEEYCHVHSGIFRIWMAGQSTFDIGQSGLAKGAVWGGRGADRTDRLRHEPMCAVKNKH